MNQVHPSSPMFLWLLIESLTLKMEAQGLSLPLHLRKIAKAAKVPGFPYLATALFLLFLRQFVLIEAVAGKLRH